MQKYLIGHGPLILSDEPSSKRPKSTAALLAETTAAAGAAAAAAAEAAAAAKDAASAAGGAGTARTAPKFVLDPERPVEVKLRLGWGHIHINLALRDKEVCLKEKRIRYGDEKSKKRMLDQVEGLSAKDAAAALSKVSGYEKVKPEQVRRWRKPMPPAKKKKMGRSVNLDFEEAVLDQMIFTSLEKVMDLIVNGPVKAGIRRERCGELFDYFQNWKVARLKAEVEKKPLPKFAPPKPKVVDGLRIIRKVCETTFTSPQFQESMRRCFIKIGLSEDRTEYPEMGFAKYDSHRRGTMPIKKEEATEKTCSVGEVVAELEVLQRAGADEDEAEKEGEEQEELEEEEEEEEEAEQ